MTRPMSKGSLTLGLFLSLAAHAALLLCLMGPGAGARTTMTSPPVIVVPPPETPDPAAPAEPAPAEPQPQEKPPAEQPVESRPAPPPEPAPAKQEPPKEEPRAQQPPPEAPEPDPLPPPIPMEEVAKPPAEPTAAEQAETAAAAEEEARLADARMDEKLLPATRIVWDGPEHLARVARALGLRIVAVTPRSEVAGEVSLTPPFRLEPFGGKLELFSNRVRFLPLSFFGPGLPAGSEHPISGFWILVPVSVDRYLAEVVRNAVRKAGMSAAQVYWVEARFVFRQGGEAAFEVVGVHGDPGRPGAGPSPGSRERGRERVGGP